MTCPTVVLVQQQSLVLSSQLPAYQCRTLSSLDDVDHWKGLATWQAALLNIQIVVSTPQVLYDAITHGFVLLQGLALIVFDEAHHCQKGHAMNKIMARYHQDVADSKSVPCILGLTASPAKSPKTMGEIEHNLNAVCKAPRRHAEELQLYVHQPVLVKLSYQTNQASSCPILEALEAVIRTFDIEQDPATLFYRSDERPRSQEKLQEMLRSGISPSLNDLVRLKKAADNVYDQLGLWATDHYLRAIVRRLKKVAGRPSALLSSVANERTNFLSKLLSNISLLPEIPMTPEHTSSKVNLLTDFLLQEHSAHVNGIIFVERRCTAVLLAALLSKYPHISERYRLSPFVGLSGHSARSSDLVEIADTRLQAEALVSFRCGTTELLTSTSVLEEGIDVSATNLVIRFNPPPNLRSYIQSRGRARKAASKFVMMLPNDDPVVKIEKWNNLEAEMKALYLQDQREIEAILASENIVEYDNRSLEVRRTGACITLDEGLRHLHHFCETLPKAPFVDNRPEFVLGLDESGGKTAKIVLPAAVDASLRETNSAKSWLTHRMAKKDCAFEAYRKLYGAGLINEHLLPFEVEAEQVDEIEHRDSFAEVAVRYDVWSQAACSWVGASNLFVSDIWIHSDQEVLEPLSMLLPIELRSKLNLRLYWNSTTIFDGTVNPKQQLVSAQSETTPVLIQITHNMLYSLFSRTMSEAVPCSVRHPYLLVPKAHFQEFDAKRNKRQVSAQLCQETRFEDLADLKSQDEQLLRTGIIRRSDRQGHVRPYAFCSFSKRGPKRIRLEYDSPIDVDRQDEGLCVEIKQLPKRLDYLHDLQSKDAHTATDFVPVGECRYDPFPFAYARMMLFFPSICHRVELRLLAQTLNETILRPSDILDVTLVETAISTPSAQEESNYDRLEFLGDVLLKVYTSFQVYSDHPQWHEGRLSHAKSLIINNGNLAKAAIACGLDQFIHTERFEGSKWKPPYNKDLLSKTAKETRQLSTKVLADVVEAIIGASYMDGSDPSSRETKTLSSLQILLPETGWSTLTSLAISMQPQASSALSNAFTNLAPLESLLGYTSTHRTLLVSALTHPSFLPTLSSTQVSSYQQLEFLGDALLDKIIVETMMSHDPPLPQSQMTLIRHALANTHILGYFCLCSSYEVTIQKPEVNPLTGETTIISHAQPHYLFQFMRHSGHPSLILAQQSSLSRYLALAPTISAALTSGTRYPWLPLLALRPEKFFSDIIESLIAAIFIDSSGDIEACRTWLRKLGFLTYLERILNEEIDCIHPKMHVGILADRRKVKYIINDSSAQSRSQSPNTPTTSPPTSPPLPTTATSASHHDQATLTPDTPTPTATPVPSDPDPEPAVLSGPYSCTILLDASPYAHVTHGGSRAEVEARAASLAIARLEAEGIALDPTKKNLECADVGGDETTREVESSSPESEDGGMAVDGAVTEEGEGGDERMEVDEVAYEAWGLVDAQTA